VRSWWLRQGPVWKPRGSGTSAVGSLYKTTASEDVTVDTTVFVIVNCKV
jgi:hypothetical protein